MQRSNLSRFCNEIRYIDYEQRVLFNKNFTQFYNFQLQSYSLPADDKNLNASYYIITGCHNTRICITRVLMEGYEIV